MKISAKKLDGFVFPYIISAIDSEGYELTKQPETEAEKLLFIAETFYNEKIKHHKNWLKYYGSLAGAFSDWLAGLPSSFNIDFEYSKIIQLSKDWGSIPQEASEKQEGKVCENFFPFITAKTFKLMRKHKINIFEICNK